MNVSRETNQFFIRISKFGAFCGKLFFRHNDTKTLTTNKTRSFVVFCLGGKYFLVPACPGWELNYENRFYAIF
jgi:hypothetical protein